MQKSLLFLLLILTAACLSACPKTLEVPDQSPYEVSQLAHETGRIDRRIFLVMPNEVTRYRYHRLINSGVGGDAFPDPFTFELGKSFSKELARLAGAVFSSAYGHNSMENAVQAANDMRGAVQVRKNKLDYIIEISDLQGQLTLPKMRLGELEAEIEMRLSVYHPNGELRLHQYVRSHVRDTLPANAVNFKRIFKAAVVDALRKNAKFWKEYL